MVSDIFLDFSGVFLLLRNISIDKLRLVISMYINACVFMCTNACACGGVYVSNFRKEEIFHGRDLELKRS